LKTPPWAAHLTELTAGTIRKLAARQLGIPPLLLQILDQEMSEVPDEVFCASKKLWKKKVINNFELLSN